jgi:hypothetical protein
LKEWSVVNGQEYNWAGLYARLDQFITLHQRVAVDTLVSSRILNDRIEALPERIASAILEQQARAAPAAASGVTGWTELARSLADFANRLLPLLLLLLLAAGLLPQELLDRLPFGLLR